MKYRIPTIIAACAVLYCACYYMAFLLRFDFALSEARWNVFLWTLPWVVFAKCTFCYFSGQYRGSLRYVTLSDATLIACSMMASTSVTYLFEQVGLLTPTIPRSVLLIDCVLATLATCLFRSTVRVHRELVCPLFERKGKIRTIIFGAGDQGIATVRMLQTMAREFDVVGFIDDCPQLIGSSIAGIPVHSADCDLGRIVNDLHITKVLISSSTSGQKVREIIQSCSQLGLDPKVIPSAREITEGRLGQTVRDVKISDLLKREPVQLDMTSIENYLNGRRVLVTGAAGSIGSELSRQILEANPELLVMVDQSESGIFHIGQKFLEEQDSAPYQLRIANVRCRETMWEIFEEFQPELVFHTAAYKHVPLMEKNPAEAVRNNVLGTKNIADLADKFSVESFILISTDKAVCPTSVMGATKLVAERYVQALDAVSNTEFAAVRFGNVLDSDGSVVPIFRRQIEMGGPLTVTHPDMKRFFMTISEAVGLLLQAGTFSFGGTILILDMGEQIKITDLAKAMIHLSGLKYPEDIDIVFTGVRPGEKLEEELFEHEERNASKLHQNIFCIEKDDISLVKVCADIAHLESACKQGRASIEQVLRRLVTEYSEDETKYESTKFAA